MATATPPPAVPSRSDVRIRDLSALVAAMTYPTIMACLYFLVLPQSASQGNPVLVWVFSVGKAVQFAFPLVFVFLADRGQLRMRPLTRGGLAPAIGFGLATSAAIIVLYFLGLRSTGLFDATAAKIHQWLSNWNLTSTAGFWLMAGVMSLLHSLLEEYYWRWFVYGWLRRWLPWGWAVVLSGLAFMSHHVILLSYYFPGNFWLIAMPFSLGVAVGGMAWAWIYERSGSIWAVWLSHCLVDLAIMVVGHDLLFGQRNP